MPSLGMGVHVRDGYLDQREQFTKSSQRSRQESVGQQTYVADHQSASFPLQPPARDRKVHERAHASRQLALPRVEDVNRERSIAAAPGRVAPRRGLPAPANPATSEISAGTMRSVCSARFGAESVTSSDPPN
jgi:hypothetical protein